MLMIGLAALAASSAAQMDVYEDYSVEIIFQQKNGLRSKTVRLKDDVDLTKGSFALKADEDDEVPLLLGTVRFAADGQAATARMTICRPKTVPCDVVAEPAISFARGQRAEVKAETPSGVYYRIRFRP